MEDWEFEFGRRLSPQNSQIEKKKQILSHLILTRNSLNLKIAGDFVCAFIFLNVFKSFV